MDPYLEGSLWMSVHTQLCAEIARQLAPLVRPRYLALTTERFVLEEPESIAVATSSIYRDVSVISTLHGDEGGKPRSAIAAPLRLATVLPAAIPHVTVEIRDAAGRQLVTAIEVLSPSNKQGDGRKEYLSKRRGLLLSSAHVLEIDFLRQGARVPTKEPLPKCHYFVFLSRAETRPIMEVWPIRLHDALPTVPVPLLPGDPDVPLNLLAAFTNVYDLLGYDLAVDYRRPSEIPLGPEDAAWAEDRLRKVREGARG